MVMMTTSTIMAQAIDDRQTLPIVEKQAFIASLRSTAASTSRTVVDSRLEKLQSLLSDVNSAIYFYAGAARAYGDRPECLYTDAASMGSLQSANIDVNNIKMITIKITSAAQLANSLDLSIFANYPKLRYVYILSSVNSTGDQIVRMVRNPGTGYRIFYSIQKAS